MCLALIACGVAAGCGGAAPGAAAAGAAAAAHDREEAIDRAIPAGYRARFELTWRGRTIGEAEERLVARPGGYRLERRERWRVRRAGALVSGELRIAIDADPALEPQRIEVTGGVVDGVAVREGDHWTVTAAGEPARVARGMPLELLALRLARSGQARWRGEVLLPGLGFATARGEVASRGPGARLLRLGGEAGLVEIAVTLRPDGTVERAVGPEIAAERGAARAITMPPDLIEESAIEVSGAAGGAGWIELTLPRPARPPAPLPGQRIELAGGGDPGPGRASGRATWRARLGPAPQAAALPAPVTALVAAVAAELEEDAAAGAGASAAEIARRGRADCVGHAVLLADRAGRAGLAARLVTGLRLDGARLVRHAWAVVQVDGRWVAVDPTTGEAPAPAGRYLALAVHGAAPHEVALAAELAYGAVAGARAAFSGPPSGLSTPRTR